MGLTTVGTMLAQTTTTATAPATSQAATGFGAMKMPASTAPNTKGLCLGCHQWAKVTEKSAGYTTTKGANVNPHVFVPHKSKADTDIPECENCHTPHSMSKFPEKGEVDLTKVNMNWCFSACHHKKNFTKCDKCH